MRGHILNVNIDELNENKTVIENYKEDFDDELEHLNLMHKRI